MLANMYNIGTYRQSERGFPSEIITLEIYLLHVCAECSVLSHGHAILRSAATHFLKLNCNVSSAASKQ